MTITAVTASRPWLLVGWTMLHFFWVGGLLGLAAAALRRALRGARPEVRYTVAMLGLAVLAVAPAVIASLLFMASQPVAPRNFLTESPATSQVEATGPLMSPRESAPPLRPISAPSRSEVGRATSTARTAPGSSHLAAAARGLPGLWLLGAPATFALLATGLIGAERLRRQSRTLTDGDLLDRCRRLATKLGVARPVALGVCDRLLTPVLLGVVRPMILLPTSALTGWSPEQVEMALLHELAHVRRLDNLVNFVQRTIESALFFHPAVWWVSGWVRLEREHCCDEVVIAQTGRARPYAELLAALAVPGAPRDRAAVAMAEAPIVDRIRRILNLEDQPMRLSRAFVALVAGLLLIAPAALITSQAGPPHQAKEQPPAPALPNRARDTRLEPILLRALHETEVISDPRERARALTRIAGAQSQSGDRDGSRRTFARAVALAETVALGEPRNPPLFLFEIWKAQENAGLRDEAFDTLEKLHRNLKLSANTVSLDISQYSPHILLWIAQAQAKAGFRDEAIGSIRKLLRIAQAPAKNDYSKIDLFAHILKTQVELGDDEGIRETLRIGCQFYTTVNDVAIRSYAPQALVSLRAESGDLAGALQILHDFAIFQGNHNKSLRHSALFSIVERIKPGDEKAAGPILEEAVQAIEPIDAWFPGRNTLARNQDLKTIAEAEARLGRFAEATKTAHDITAENVPKQSPLNREKYKKARTFACIGEEQAKLGDRAGAKQSAAEVARIAMTMADDSDIDYPLELASKTLAKIGDLAGALRLADTMTPDRQANQYLGISWVQRELGDTAGAQATLDAALRHLQTRFDALDPDQPDSPPTVTSKRDKLLRDMSWIQSERGDLKGALQTTQRINSSTVRIQVTTAVARSRATMNDLDGAMEAIGNINSPKLEAEALEAVLDAVSQRGASGG